MNIVWKKRGDFSTIAEVLQSKLGKPLEKVNEKVYHSSVAIENMAQAFLEISEPVFICGDYDVDGIMSSVILSLIFDELNVPYEVYIPRRMSDGYGISEKITEKISQNVVITIDNGIAAAKVLNDLKKSGKKILVIDHHMAPEDGVLPDADVLLDPEVSSDMPFTHYCGAGLAYKIAVLLYQKKKISIKNITRIIMAATIATIADVMPLVDENRSLVISGLSFLNKGCWPQLKRTLDLPDGMTAKDVAFRVAPCINAAGRMQDDGGQRAYGIIYQSILTNNGNLDYLYNINEERKAVQMDVYDEIYSANAEALAKNPVVVFASDCPEGIAGIIAGRIAERTKKMTFVFTETEEGLCKGSARAGDSGENVKNFLDVHNALFLKYGGHVGAGGMTMTKESLEKLQNLCEPDEADRNMVYEYDLEISQDEVSAYMHLLAQYEPFGEGFEPPVFRIRLNLRPYSKSCARLMGSDNSTVKLYTDDFSAIGFGMTSKYQHMQSPVLLDAIGTINRNWYNGKVSVQFELIDMKDVVRKQVQTPLMQAILQKATG